MIKRKKAQIFATGLVVITFVAMVFALGSFMFVKEKIKISVMPSKDIIEMYNEKEMSIMQNKEILKLQMHQSFYDIAKNGAVYSDKCVVKEENYVEWSKDCMPETDEIRKEISGKLSSENIVKKISEHGYADYEMDYLFDPSAELNPEELEIDLNDFKSIYNQAVNCRQANAEKVKSCMNLERWKVDAKISNNLVLFDLSTKKSFFFDGKFSPVELKFAIKI